MDKYIQVKQGFNVLFLPEEVYHQLLKDYENMKAELLKVCGERCDRCRFADKYRSLKGNTVHECQIQTLFDPRENQLN